jgi:hypothetical protein
MTRTFKLYGFDDLGTVTRTFILTCVALSYPAWDLGFQLGAFGRVFFEKILFVWAIATALLLALSVSPETRRSIPVKAWVATAFPSVWILLALAAHAAPEELGIRYPLFFSGLLIYGICLPYVVYMVVSLLYPDLLKADNRYPRLVVAFFILFAALGYLAGRYHPFILTCEDFEVSGQFVPEDCRPARTDLRAG